MTFRCVHVEDGEIELQSRPDPTPEKGQAVVEITRSGLSHLDAAIGQGRVRFRGVPGQEIVGRVTQVDSEHDAWTSSRVVIDPLITCGQCRWCGAGLRSQCSELRIIGRTDADGGLATHVVVPVESLVNIPEHVDDDSAVFAVPVSRAIQAARQATIQGQTYVTIVGDNALALLTAQVLVRLNASVRVLGEHETLLDRCERWGIRHRRREEAGYRADQDIVVECTGERPAVEATLGFVRPRGTIIQMIAPRVIGAGGTPLDLQKLVDGEIRLIGSSFGPIREALDLIATDQIDVVSLVGVRKRLEDVPAILPDPQLATGRKVLIAP